MAPRSLSRIGDTRCTLPLDRLLVRTVRDAERVSREGERARIGSQPTARWCSRSPPTEATRYPARRADVLFARAEECPLAMSAARATALTVIVAPEAAGVLRERRLHEGAIRAIERSADGARIATGGDDGWIHLLEVSGARSTRSVASSGPGAPVLALAFVGARLIACRDACELQILHAHDLSPETTLALPSPATHAQRWVDTVVVACRDGSVVQVDPEARTLRIFEAAAVSAQGLARCGADDIAVATRSELVLIDPRTGAIVRRSLQELMGGSLREGSIRALRGHPDDRRVVLHYSYVEMELYVVDGLVIVDPMSAWSLEHVVVDASAGAPVLLLSGGTVVLGGLAKESDPTASPRRFVVPALGFGITACAIPPGAASEAIVGDADGVLRVWDLLALCADEPARIAREAPAGELAILRKRSRRVQRRELEHGGSLEAWTLPHLVHPDLFALQRGRVALSAGAASAGVSTRLFVLDAGGARVLDGNDLLPMILASTVARGGALAALVGYAAEERATRGSLLVVDLASGDTIDRVAHGFWYARAVLLSADGAFAFVDELTASAFVSVRDGSVVSRPHGSPPARVIGFAHPGGWLAVGEGLSVLDPHRGTPIAVHDLPAGVPGREAVVDLDDGGRRVALAGAGVVHVLDLERGRSVELPRASSSAVTALTFSPDGRRLAIGHSDGTIAAACLDRNALLGAHDGVERVTSIAMPRSDRIAAVDVRGRVTLLAVTGAGAPGA